MGLTAWTGVLACFAGIIAACELHRAITGIRRGQQRWDRKSASVTAPTGPVTRPPGHRCGPVLTRVNIHAGGCVWRWDRATRKWTPEKHTHGIDWDELEKELKRP